MYRKSEMLENLYKPKRFWNDLRTVNHLNQLLTKEFKRNIHLIISPQEQTTDMEIKPQYWQSCYTWVSIEAYKLEYSSEKEY